MVNRLLLDRILFDLESNIKDLRAEQKTTFEVYQSDKKLRRYIERTLHISVETVIDTAQHLISDLQLREPNSYRDTFLVLAENGIINQDLLGRLEKMAAFRNLIVHYYERIDDAIVYGIIKNHLDDFEEFIRQIGRWLAEQVPREEG